MKLQMKLRTRLFLGFSALMTVALLGLLLALVSVMQMAKSQEQLSATTSPSSRSTSNCVRHWATT